WLSILRFDSEAHLQAWLDSPERKALLEESGAFTQEFHARIARTGFDQWFPSGAPGTKPAPAWKQNMIALLLLYPLVFLFGYFVQAPLLVGHAGLPFAVALFIGNVVSITSLNYLVPWTSIRFAWWLSPAQHGGRRIDAAGGALLILFYAALVFVFTRFL